MLSVTVKRTILIVMPERPVLNLRNGLYQLVTCLIVDCGIP